MADDETGARAAPVDTLKPLRAFTKALLAVPPKEADSVAATCKRRRAKLKTDKSLHPA
jgi:hypothetical protein